MQKQLQSEATKARDLNEWKSSNLIFTGVKPTQLQQTIAGVTFLLWVDNYYCGMFKRGRLFHC